MTEPLPDHYKALGVDKTADTAAIKSAHRKLVLKCHPDKVTDPELKQQKQEEFHRIQQAYEVLSDEDKRKDYEAHLTLDALRKEKAARTATAEKTARFDVRTPGGATFSATGPSRYSTEERRPSRTYEDDRYYDSRKYDTYDAYPKAGASPRTRTEKDSKSARASADRTRSERQKTRDREDRSNRRFNSVENESSESDEKSRYEAGYKRRSAEAETRQPARESTDSRRKVNERRSYEDTHYGTSPTHRKMSAQEEEALRYQGKSRVSVEPEVRPSPSRTTSSRDYFNTDTRSSRRPETVRRSSARPKERPTSAGRDTARGIPEIVDWGEDRRTPSFMQTSSSPANIEIPRAMPVRSYTETTRDHRRTENSPPPPAFHRSSTMPTAPHTSSSRRKESVARPSTLRETMTPEYTTTEHVPAPPSQNRTKYYHYTNTGASASVRPEELPAFTTSHRTVLREPERRLQRSPSPRERAPLGRPPIGANRPSETSTSSHPKATAPQSSSRAVPVAATPEERGRSRPLYGAIGGGERRGRQASYGPSEAGYSRQFDRNDVKWAERGGESREYAAKPSMNRAATFVH